MPCARWSQRTLKLYYKNYIGGPVHATPRIHGQGSQKHLNTKAPLNLSLCIPVLRNHFVIYLA